MLCRSSRVSYSEKKVVGGEDVEKKVAAALKDTARGMGLRGAARKHDAPYTSLHKAWVALGGQELAASLLPRSPSQIRRPH